MVLEAQAGSRVRHPVVELLIFCALFAVCSAIQNAVLLAPTLLALLKSGAFSAMLAGEAVSYADLMDDLPPWYTLVSLFSTAVVVAGVIIYCRFLEKRSLATMGIVRRSAVREYVAGWLIGAGLISLALVPGLLAGDIRLTGPAQSPEWGMLLMLTAFGVQGLSEELLCRSYLCVSLARSVKLQWAVVVSSVVFALLHSFNSGLTLLAVVNLFLYGVFAALWLLRRGSVWGIAAMHSAWNFVQGNIWGSTVSGINTGGSFFLLEHTGVRTLWAGGRFGLEGGLGVTLVLVAGIAVLCRMKNRSPESINP